MREGALAVGEILHLAGTVVAQTFDPDVPHAWNDKDVTELEVPLAQRDRSPRDDTLQSIAIGAAVHRDILLPAGALGNPPCEPGTSASVPYPEK